MTTQKKLPLHLSYPGTLIFHLVLQLVNEAFSLRQFLLQSRGFLLLHLQLLRRLEHLFERNYGA